ncbi:hypothetical protein F2P81_025978 [Scophthalmus maximus]|uniref:Uncharacterized protein n=1 Tax=Scophthalmus maximus TaxID=52904 RepID=A0A6A4RNC9_SCOMX|nr:hypothetical protein F2P81_025978 [Scophthalmus maximus]
MLLENLWACVEPQQQHSENQLHLKGDASSKSYAKQVLPSSPQNSHLSYTSLSAADNNHMESHNHTVQTNTPYTQLKPSPRARKANKPPASPQCSRGKRQMDTPPKNRRLSKEHKTVESSTDPGSSDISIEEMMEMFEPMLPCISPLPDSCYT